MKKYIILIKNKVDGQTNLILTQVVSHYEIHEVLMIEFEHGGSFTIPLFGYDYDVVDS